MNLPIVVTGASGGLGWHLCRFFASRGVSVIGTYAEQRPELAACQIERLRLERSDELVDFLQRWPCRAFIHAAAMTSPDACERDPALTQRVNVEATHQIAQRLDPSTLFVFTSTDLVFDGQRGHYSEDDEPCPVNGYGRSKLAAEPLAMAHPRGVVLRLAKLYGDESPHHGSFEQWIRRRVAAALAVPLFEDEFRSLLYVGDVARALERVLESPSPHQLYHLGGPERVSRLEFGHRYAAEFGLDATQMLPSSAAARGGVARGGDCSLDSTRFCQAYPFAPSSLSTGLAKLKSGTL